VGVSNRPLEEGFQMTIDELIQASEEINKMAGMTLVQWSLCDTCSTRFPGTPRMRCAGASRAGMARGRYGDVKLHFCAGTLHRNPRVSSIRSATRHRRLLSGTNLTNKDRMALPDDVCFCHPTAPSLVLRRRGYTLGWSWSGCVRCSA